LVKIRPIRYGNKSPLLRPNELNRVKVKIRPIRYGNDEYWRNYCRL